MRYFSDSVKYAVIKNNIDRNNGRVCCEACGEELKSISEVHFDHIEAFSKSGKSTKENCQILCCKCNLKKQDKEYEEFRLSEKARRFLEGNIIDHQINNNEVSQEIDSHINNNASETMTKEIFDTLVFNFVEENGKINKVDFYREYNNLPSYSLVEKYYGNIKLLRKSFNVKESVRWNREKIKERLQEYIAIHGNIYQKDLKSKNGLPSYPCILKNYPEYTGLNELKSKMFNIKVNTRWTREKAIEAGKKFVKKNGKITLKDLRFANNLPTGNVIYKYFGTMGEYQKEIGSIVSQKNELITMNDIDQAVERVLTFDNREFETRKDLFKIFPISESTVCKIFGSFDFFANRYDIKIIKQKKAKYSRKEVDDLILNYVKDGKPIPSAAKKLTSLGLPSRDTILRYYRNWSEPFVLYSKLCEKINFE